MIFPPSLCDTCSVPLYMTWKSGMTLFLRNNLRIILCLYCAQQTEQRQPWAEVGPSIRYSFGDDGQIAASAE